MTPDPTTDDVLGWPRKTVLLTNIVLWLAALAAAATLTLGCGFGDADRPVPLTQLHIVQAGVLAIFVLDRLARLLTARRRGAYLRRNGIDFILMLAAVAALAAGGRAQILGAAALYVLLTQLYAAGAAARRRLSASLQAAHGAIHPSCLMLAAFAILSLTGAGLLMLPAATPPVTSGNYKIIYFSDAIFTAVSAVCCAGLTLRNVGLEFTPFGQVVILALVQIGAILIMLLGTLLILRIGRALWQKPGPDELRQSKDMARLSSDALLRSRRSYAGLAETARFLILTTLAVEAVGAVLMYPMFASVPDIRGQETTVAAALWQSVFHSVSAFCNAGFSLYGRNLMAGVGESGWSHPLRSHWQIMGVMAPLIILGGLGWPVLADCAAHLADWMRLLARSALGRRSPADKTPPAISLHSEIVLWTTSLLILGGAWGLIGVEPSGGAAPPSLGRQPVGRDAGSGRMADWRKMSFRDRVRPSLFLSLSARTAGFSPVDLGELSDAGKFWLCGLMIVGGGPASAAGGMKVVTAALLALALWSLIRRRDRVTLFGQPLPWPLIHRAVAAGVLYLLLVGVVTLLLSIAMRPGFSFVDLLLESCSACGTVGLTTGITPSLTDFGKCVLIGGMFFGRLGATALLLAAVRPDDRIGAVNP